jgi:Heterokaryon incompatibility protein (HET)
MAPFQYKPLLQPDSIRLLCLEPSTDHSSLVQCSLVQTTLTDCKHEIIDHYTALSYVWGDPAASEAISVDEKTFHVTTNLFNALRDLRDDHRVQRLWIDAICIDQSNLEERNRQVSMMGMIYMTAQHTIIYLGGKTPHSAWVFEALSTMESSGATPVESVLPSLQNAVHEFQSQPWFTRVWIYQELVLSRDPWIQLGRARIGWETFCNRIEIVRHEISKTSSAQVHFALYDILDDMDSTRRRHHAARFDGTVPRPKLIDVLHSRRGFGTRDPRDRIFAHLGIADDLHIKKELNVKVDYSKTVVEVFTDLTMKAIFSTRTLDILKYVEAAVPGSRSPGLPSWVPDCRYMGKVPFLFLAGMISFSGGFLTLNS